jgi:signal transduction histidine kinase
MLEQDLAARPAEAATACKIAQAVRGRDAVVGDVLVVARELRARPTEVEAAALFMRALDACQGERPLAVRVEREGDGTALFVDPILLTQALVNVIRNALQAMESCPPPPGGHVLALAAGPSPRRDEPRHATLTITDTGPGIDPAAVDRMFNPFFTTRATGTGLGLAIVHRIVDAHAGRVTASARPDGLRGAAFELSVPSAPDAPPARQEAPA